jgi:hypothetical protein
MSSLETSSSPAPVARRHPLAILFGVIVRPRDTFTYLRDHGGWSWLVPVGIVMVLTLLARLIAVPIERAQAEAARAALEEQIGNLPDGPGGDTFFRIGPGGAGPVGASATPPGSDWLVSYALPLGSVLLDWVVRGLALFGLAWLVGGRPKLGAMFQLGSWALLPSAARLLVTMGVMLVAQRIPATGLQLAPNTPVITSNGDETAPPSGEQTFTVGPGGASFSGELNFANLFGMNFLQTVDVYRLWEMVLLVIGVVVMARLDWFRSVIPPLGYWGLSVALATLPLLLMPLIMPMLFGGPALGP